MEALYSNPLFGLGITLFFGWIGLWTKAKIRRSWMHPMLLSIVLIVSFLTLLNIPYASYKIGADFIHAFLGPITVILAVPLYQHHDELRRHALPIAAGVAGGSLAALLSVWFLSALTGLDEALMRALMPKSITTPIGISAAQMLNASEGLSVLAIVITGILGVLIAPLVFTLFKITHPVARGVALGTTAHAIGTGKAFEYGKLEGAMSGLCIGLAGITSIGWIMLLRLWL